MTRDALHRALARTEARLLADPGVDALLARRDIGRVEPDDERRAAEFAAEIYAEQERDGSWRNDLVATAERLLRLREILDGATDDGERPEPVARALEWLRSRRGAPGRLGDGCTAATHRLGLCHHFLGGFFAPTAEAMDREAILESGARLPAGPGARLGGSCVALRACLHWGAIGPDVILHLDGLRRITLLLRRDEDGIAPIDVLPLIIHTLVEARSIGRKAGEGDELDAALTRLLQMQRADGSWPELDAFHVLDVLLTAWRAGHTDDAVDSAIRRGAGLLAVTQQADGTWERDADVRRTRIGWRALRFAAEPDRDAPPPED